MKLLTKFFLMGLLCAFFKLNGQSIQLIGYPQAQLSKSSLFNLSLINSSNYSGPVLIKASLYDQNRTLWLSQELNDIISPNENKLIQGSHSSISTTYTNPKFSDALANEFLPPLNFNLCYEVISRNEVLQS